MRVPVKVCDCNFDSSAGLASDKRVRSCCDFSRREAGEGMEVLVLAPPASAILTSCRSQRRTAAGFVEKDVSRDCRRLLGHANISTTQRYMHLDDRELSDAQDLVE